MIVLIGVENWSEVDILWENGVENWSAREWGLETELDYRKDMDQGISESLVFVKAMPSVA